MENICRPFILYNDFLPPKEDIHTGWQYLSFGYNDGVSVGENLFSENKECNLRVMWDYYVRNHTGNLDGSFSSQIIFGLRSEKENVFIRDTDFWKEGVQKEYPFLFVSLIQINKSANSNEQNDICNIASRENLEKELNQSVQMKAITYLTFDGSDLILVLLCKQYYEGAEAINFLRFADNKQPSNINWEKITYSFTIGAVFKKFLNEEALVEKVEGEITHAYIYIIEKRPGGSANICSMIKDSLAEAAGKCLEARENILGCNDEMILLKDIPWKQFLALYRDKTGILNHSHRDYGNNLIGVTTIIGETQSNQHCAAESGSNVKLNSLCTLMRNRCNKPEQFGNWGNSDGIKSSLCQVINSIQKFETSPFSDYLFQAALLPLNMVISMVGEVEERDQEADFFVSFYDFIKGINLFAKNSVRSDRQFTQSPDLNIRLYEAPVKINAFYNAFIFQLKKYLNEFEMEKKGEEKHQYEFLSCPGTTSNMRMLELFKSISKTKRLLVVEIPENQVYNPRVMLVMLAHEVGHVVGTGIRNRSGRRRYMNQIATKISINYMRVNLERYIEDKITDSSEFGMNASCSRDWREKLDWKKYWDEAEKKLLHFLDNFTTCDNYIKYLEENKFIDCDREQLKKASDLVRKRFDYSEVVRLTVSDGVIEALSDEKEIIWSYLLEKYFLFWLETDAGKEKEEKAALKIEIEKIIRKGNSFSPWNSEMFSVSVAVNKVMYLFQECFADLIGILTLRISMKDYLSTIVQSAADQGFTGDFSGSILQIRSSIITFCMQKEIGGFGWSEADLKEFDNSTGNENQELNDFCKGIVGFIKTYLNIGCAGKSSDKIPRMAIDALFSTDVLIFMIKYLSECRDIFESQNAGGMQDLQKKLRGAYEIFDNINIEEIEQNMQRYLDQYSEELRVELEKHIEEDV